MSDRGPTGDRPDTPAERRQAWRSGPSIAGTGASWRGFDDDALLGWLQSLPPDHDEDGQLLEIVSSDRHFYLRQTAALSIRDPESLKDFSGDRHVGQILARRLSRAEDIHYLSVLVRTSRHLEVRRAAQAQLTSLLSRFGTPPESKLPPTSTSGKA